MKALWKQYAGRFDALSLRERRLIALALWGGLLLIGYSLMIEPGLSRGAAARQSLAQRHAEADGLLGQLTLLQEQLRQDPDAKVKADLREAQIQLNDAGDRIKAFQSNLVPPEAMRPLLEKVLKRFPGLRLVSLKTLPPEGLLHDKGAKDKKAGEEQREVAPMESVNLYRHGVEIQVEGSYADLSAYLASLESGEQHLLWREARLKVEEYPKSVLTLTFYTLSSEKAWLAL